MMSEEKCCLASMPWYSVTTGIDTPRTDCIVHVHPCYICGASICAHHRTILGICDKCTTLHDKWADWRKEKYEKIYMTTTKAYRQ